MAENIKCPRCGFKGQMNRFIRPLSSKDKNSIPKHSKYKLFSLLSIIVLNVMV
jgi:hypothetical protein